MTPGLDLASHYSRFRVSERVLLTGHSHQAWPDVAFDAQQRAWLDAAELVDDKWERAAAVADEVRRGWRRLLNDEDGDIALGQNTHELVVRWLSAVLPVFSPTSPIRLRSRDDTGELRRDLAGAPADSRRARRRARLITTDGEFHTIRRQLDRLAEEGIDVLKIAARPAETLAERVAAAIDDRTACALVSSVLFEIAEIVPHLAAIAEACDRHGASLLIDAYHHLNVVPFDLAELGLQHAFVVGGGYKYCQLGEGNCFLRVPPHCELRPVLTGWFSEFAKLADAKTPGEVRYGAGPARFAGATYDPTSHYRAAAVFAFHQDAGLTPPRLRAVNQDQVTRLTRGVEALDLDPSIAHVIPMPPERRGGFLAIRSPRAAALVTALRARNMFTDARGDILRLGPAPYVAESQLSDAIDLLGEVLRSGPP